MIETIQHTRGLTMLIAVIAAAPDVIGIAIGTFTDPTFPPPKISGFEKYGHPWAMKAADLPIIRLELAE